MFQELVNVKRNLGQIDCVRSVALIRLSQGCCACKPSCIPPHDLDDCDDLLVVGQSQSVADDLLGGSCNVLGSAAEAGRMIRKSQVVVYGLGHAQELLMMSLDNCIV